METAACADMASSTDVALNNAVGQAANRNVDLNLLPKTTWRKRLLRTQVLLISALLFY
jgi:hypothetical protein